MKPNWESLCGLAEAEIERVLGEMPDPLRERAEKVPVIWERQPSIAMQNYGIEEDTLGLFAGPEWVEAGEVPLPPQIFLYLENLWEASETDEKRFRDEIETTFLHELGHFLGLDEEGLSERGLE